MDTKKHKLLHYINVFFPVGVVPAVIVLENKPGNLTSDPQWLTSASFIFPFSGKKNQHLALSLCAKSSVYIVTKAAEVLHHVVFALSVHFQCTYQEVHLPLQDTIT